MFDSNAWMCTDSYPWTDRLQAIILSTAPEVGIWRECEEFWGVSNFGVWRGGKLSFQTVDGKTANNFRRRATQSAFRYPPGKCLDFCFPHFPIGKPSPASISSSSSSQLPFFTHLHCFIHSRVLTGLPSSTDIEIQIGCVSPSHMWDKAVLRESTS